ASASGAEGRRFESCRGHTVMSPVIVHTMTGDIVVCGQVGHPRCEAPRSPIVRGSDSRTILGRVTPEELKDALASALAAVRSSTGSEIAAPASLVVERPKNRDHGDWSSNIALQLAKSAGMPPRQLAEELAARLRENPGIDAVDVAGPGF